MNCSSSEESFRNNDSSYADYGGALSVSSSRDFSDFSLSLPNLGEKFVEILKLSGTNDALIPEPDVINNFCHNITGCGEFAEWFCSTISASNVVTQEELAMYEQYKHISIDEINTYLDDVINDKTDKISVSADTVDELTQKEKMVKEEHIFIEKTRKQLLSDLAKAEQNRVSLIKVIKQTKIELKEKLLKSVEMSDDCLALSERVLDKIKNYTCSNENSDRTVNEEKVEFFSQIDLSSFNELNSDLHSSLTSLYNKLLQNSCREKDTVVTVAHLKDIYSRLGDVERRASKKRLAEFLAEQSFFIDRQVISMQQLFALSQQWSFQNKVVSGCLDFEAKQLSAVSLVLDSLIACLSTVPSRESLFDSIIEDSSLVNLNEKLHQWNEALTGSRVDFITVNEFAEALQEFVCKLEECKVNLVQFLQPLNKNLIEGMNTVYNLLSFMNELAEINVNGGDAKIMSDCKEKIVIFQELSKKLTISLENKVKKSVKNECDNLIIQSLTDPDVLTDQIKVIEREVEILELGAASILKQ